MQRITFIGAGNMANSLIRGLLSSSNRIAVADPVAAQLSKFDDLEIDQYNNNQAAVEGAHSVMLAVKPQVAGEVLQSLVLRQDQLLISIAAGINCASMSAWTHPSQPLIRCMPNTPALLGAGITALYANPNCTDAHRQNAEEILKAAGETVWVDRESDLDTVTALSGSGPAYFFLLMEAMIEAGKNLGLSETLAMQLTQHTALGAARMALETGDSAHQLRQNVTSPGGTTAAALDIMHNHHLSATVERAVQAAQQRAIELSKEFGHPS